MRRRIWCEFLPADELAADATIALLQRFELEPLVALSPEAESPAFADALAKLSRAGIRLGLWPLLSDSEGYWPSEPTADAFVSRVHAVQRFAAAAGAEVATIAVDLEPPLGVTRELLGGPLRRRAQIFADQLAHIDTPERRAQRKAACATLTRLRGELGDSGIETLAAVVPHVALDLAATSDFWQAMLRTPATAPDWSAVSVMLYTSILEQQLPPPRSLARALLFEAARATAATMGPRASLSIGLVSHGKLGDEPTYDSPRDLERDVALARAAGVDDLALFSLEGTLRRGAPERWLRPYVQTAAIMPPDDLARMVVRATARGVGLLSRLRRA